MEYGQKAESDVWRKELFDGMCGFDYAGYADENV